MSKYTQQQRYVEQEVPGAASDIRSRIRIGEYQPGQILTYPGLRDVNPSPNIIAGALKILREEGLLETRPHIGTRVKTPDQEWTTTEDGCSHADHIERIMRQRVAEDYSPGLKLPTLEAISEEFGVSISTAKVALQPLKKEGLIYSTPQGTFVSRPPTAPGSPERENSRSA